MKKKVVTSQDIKVWKDFINNLNSLVDKDSTLFKEKKIGKSVKTIDLHGLSLENANQKVLRFIYNSYENGFKKLKIITGKGQRSKNLKNPYSSRSLGILRNSVPDFIENNPVINKISRIEKAEKKNEGDGAFYIYLKK